MSASDLERNKALIMQVKSELSRAGVESQSTLLKPKAAALELGLGLSKLRELIDAGVISTIDMDRSGRPLVPRSEIERIAKMDAPKVWLKSGASKRLAAVLAKLRTPEPGAKELAVKVRAARRARKPR